MGITEYSIINAIYGHHLLTTTITLHDTSKKKNTRYLINKKAFHYWQLSENRCVWGLNVNL